MNQVNKSENMYQRGKIYKLTSYQTDKVYVGSTTEPYLSNRLSKHRSDYKRHLAGKSSYVTSFKMLEYDDVAIVLIENYPCDDKNQLEARERHWIEQFNCVNKIIPTRTAWEYRQLPEVKENRRLNNQKYRTTEKGKAAETRSYRKINCECGSEFVRSVTRHERSEKHQKYCAKLLSSSTI